MSIEYDITVIGNNLQSALLARNACNLGLKVRLLFNTNTFLGSDNERFILFEQQFYCNFFGHLKQKRIIKDLKKDAAHLLISTEVEQYKPLSLFFRLIIGFNNIISSKKIVLQKVSCPKKLFLLSYSSYKISVNRLSVRLVKSIDNEVFTIKKYNKIVSFERKEDYQITLNYKGLNEKLLTKSVLSSDFDIPNLKHKNYQSKGKANVVFYMTYPADKLKLEKNIIFQHGQGLVKIIPWFDWVYFEFSGYADNEPIIDQLLELLNKHFPYIVLSKDEMAVSGIYKKTSNNKQNEMVDFIYFANNQQYDIHARSLKRWLIDANKVCKQILSWNGKNTLKTKLSQNKRLKGSDFDFPYHPLRLMEFCDEKYDEAKQILKSPQNFKKLFYRYGSHIEEITFHAFEFWNQTKNIQQAWLMAEIWYSIHHEFCTSASEFVNNRTEEWMAGKNAAIEFIENAFDDLLKEG